MFTGQATAGPSMSLEYLAEFSLSEDLEVRAFGYNSEILLEGEDNLHVCKLNGTEYSMMWTKPLPAAQMAELYQRSYRGAVKCRGAISGTGTIVLQPEDYEWMSMKPSLCYNHHLEHIRTHWRRGLLLDCTEDGFSMYMYAQGPGEEPDWIVEVYGDSDKPELTLVPPGERRRWFSVCSVAERFVMVEEEHRCLDIFSKQGRGLFV